MCYLGIIDHVKIMLHTKCPSYAYIYAYSIFNRQHYICMQLAVYMYVPTFFQFYRYSRLQLYKMIKCQRMLFSSLIAELRVILHYDATFLHVLFTLVQFQCIQYASRSVLDMVICYDDNRLHHLSIILPSIVFMHMSAEPDSYMCQTTIYVGIMMLISIFIA